MSETSKVLKPNTLAVLKSRYFQKDSQGNVVEDWESLCRRVADFVATGEIVAWQESNKDLHKSMVPRDIVNRSESLTQEFYDLLWSQKFSPNSPTWFNAGTKYPMLSACFILPVEDSIFGIFKAVQDGAVIFKYGGGIGMDFSFLRAEGARTTMGGVASGPLSFMQAFQTMSDTMTQGGRRRGAMMSMLDVQHPEILYFIDCKRKVSTERSVWLKDRYGLEDGAAEGILKDLDWKAPYNGFNISVKLTDEFMSAVEGDRFYPLRNPQDGNIHEEYWPGDPRKDSDIVWVDANGGIFLQARKVWQRIVEGARNSAEPGICFIDRINRDNPVKSVGEIHNSNPCGEFYLTDYASCNLGSINLSAFVSSTKNLESSGSWNERIRWDELAQVTRLATRFLDHVISLNRYPLPEIHESSRRIRPVGLGVMGFADLLLSLGVPYGSSESVEIAARVMQFIQYEAWCESAQLAKKFGQFPELAANREYFDAKMLRLERERVAQEQVYRVPFGSLVEDYRAYGLRNCHVTVIAPTGTISLLAECSSGIEPVFSYEMRREDSVGTRDYVHPFMEEWKMTHPGAPRPRFAVDAGQVAPMEHVWIQEAFQKYTDNAVSKTTNLPVGSTIEDVEKVYLEAWKRDLKGITVYVEGSREGVLHRKSDEPTVSSVKGSTSDDLAPGVAGEGKNNEQGSLLHDRSSDWRRPAYLPGGTWKVEIPKGNLYVTANWDTKLRKVIEVFMRENSGNEHVELNGRLISLLLRTGLPMQKILKQLRRTRGEQSIWHDGECYTSVAQVVAHVMEVADKFFRSVDRSVLLVESGDVDPPYDLPDPPDQVFADLPDTVGVKTRSISGTCPECGSGLIPSEGCHKCLSCGYSSCGGVTK